MGPEKAWALPTFHNLTGCDTLSNFTGHDKKTAWAIWTVLPELTYAQLKMSTAPSDLPEDVVHIIDRFIILQYDRISTCTDIEKTRKKLFVKKNNVHLILPTKAALSRGRPTRKGHAWGNATPHQSCLHQPAVTGPRMRSRCTSRTEQDYPTQPTPGMSVKRCKYKKVALECTALCVCVHACVHACEVECSHN